MLRIYPVALSMVKDVCVLQKRIAKQDSDLARQLRRSSMSVVLNLNEGSATRAGKRRMRYEDALGSAQETLGGLEAAEAVGYLPNVPEPVRDRLLHVIRTLRKLV